MSDAAGQVLTAIDGNLTEEKILARLNNVSGHAFKEAMTWLLEGGFIRLIDSELFSFSQPNVPSNASIQVQEVSFDEFEALPNTALSDQKRKKNC